MKPFRHTFSYGVALALALALAGCGGSALQSVTSSSGLGATIQGSVEGAGAASAAARAASSGSKIRVTVVGTGVSTLVDSSGTFVLSGLPSGSVSLRFEGKGIDATLEIEGLVEGQVLSIRVTLSGSRATLVAPGATRQTELTGSVESITPPSLRVSGRTVLTDAETEFKGKGKLHSLADLSVGDRVKVEGTALANGDLLAREIKRLDRAEDDQDEDEVEIRGRIESLTPPTLVVAGRSVVTDANTRIERHDDRVTLAALLVGDVVEVEGVVMADGRVLARKIEVRNGDDDDDDDDDHQGDDDHDDDDNDNSGSGGDDDDHDE